MKLNVITLALVATAFGAVAANAQTTIITEERAPAVVIERPAASTTTTVKEERSGLLGTEKKTTVETTGSGIAGDCSTRTVQKEGLTGSKTVTRSTC